MKDTSKVANIWNKQLGEENSLAPHEHSFFSILLEIAKSAQKILEVGVGRGRMIKILQKNGIKADFFSVDLWACEVQGCKVYQSLGDARCLPFKDNSYDFVYSLGVVEHFPETATAIFECCRVVKDGGYVLVSTPRLSLHTIVRQIIFFVKRESQKGTFEQVRGRNLTVQTIKSFFQDAGMTILYAGASGVFIPGFGSLGISHLEKILPKSLLGAYLYCVGKKGG